jgi:hypothetical protein
MIEAFTHEERRGTKVIFGIFQTQFPECNKGCKLVIFHNLSYYNDVKREVKGSKMSATR